MYIHYKSFLLHYYSLSRTQLSRFYKQYRNKVRIRYLKDLFVFLEYKVSFFTNKYLNINVHSLDTFKIQIICFNVLLFFNPIILKNKVLLIDEIYKKTYSYLFDTFNNVAATAANNNTFEYSSDLEKPTLKINYV